MIKSFSMSMSCVVAVSFAASAQAQLSTGASGQPGSRSADASEYWWAYGQLGSCLAKNKARASLALMNAIHGSEDEAKAVYGLIGRPTMCLRHLSRMGILTTDLRGVVAEGLYKEAGAPLLPEAEFTVRKKMDGDEAERIGVFGLTAELADCFVTRKPAEARKLLTTPPGSEEEGAALITAAPAFKACSPGSVTFQLSAIEYRGAVAEALYRRWQKKIPS